MYRVEQVGGLAVAFSPADTTAIERELRRLDPNLFLDFETNGRYVYPVVMEWVGERHAPPAIPVLVWKDEDGPKPLSMAIVEHVKRQERRDDRLLERIHRHNASIGTRLEEESDERYDDVIRDFERAARNGHFSGPVHRSRRLYQSRSRARAKGH